MDRQKIERSIKGLSEWQMHVQAESDIDTNISAAIEALKAQLSQQGTTSETISRQDAIDAVDSETVSTNPEHFKSSEKFIKFMDDDDIASFGRWQWANGFNTALTATTIQLKKLPPAQPEEIALHESCTDCPLYDKDRYRCPRFNKVIPETLRELQLAQSEQRWIPVSERVPEDYVDVLVWFEYFRYGNYNRMYATHGIGNYSKEYNSWAINHETGWKDLHVFAWMPLPEPYGKEDVQDEQT